MMVVGLGNPGSRYETSRHNAGFMAIDCIAERHGVTRWKEEQHALTATYVYAGVKIMLVKPQTFMNLSGEAVGPLARYYRIDPADIYVIYDDMDLPTGQLRMRVKGSDGGHNGMKSIISHLGTKEYPRLRVGVGRPAPGWTVVNHVLASPAEDEVAAFRKGIEAAAKAVDVIAQEGFDVAMNRCNPRHHGKSSEGKARE